jgi:hypothetical protein
MTTTAKPIQALRRTGRALLTAPASVVIAVVDMAAGSSQSRSLFVRNCPTNGQLLTAITKMLRRR